MAGETLGSGEAEMDDELSELLGVELSPMDRIHVLVRGRGR